MKYLLHLSDHHLFEDTSRAGYGGIVPYDTLATILSTVFRGDAACDIHAVIVTGDISGDNSKESYQHFVELIEQYVSVPVYVIPGNHDNNSYFDALLSKYHLRSGNSVQIGNWRLHGIDTRFEGTRGRVDKRHLYAIANDIQEHSKAFHLLAMHHHIVPSKSWMDTHELCNASEFVTWVTQTPNIKGIIHGHVHNPLSNYVGEHHRIPVLAAPASCWQWEMTDSFSLSDEPPGYQIIALHDDGVITNDVRRIKTL